MPHTRSPRGMPGEVTGGAFVGFAELHLGFARRAADVLGISRREALQTWTPAFGLSGGGWAQTGYPDAHALAAAYVRHQEHDPPLPGAGCFGYSYEAREGAVRLHFVNRHGAGALSVSQRPQRRSELGATLRHARERHPEAQGLRAGSWLYNLPGYQALFPPRILATARPADPRGELEFMALWGQFLRGDCTLYRPRAAFFAGRFSVARDERELLAAFPMHKLDWHARLDEICLWLGHAGRRPG